MIAGKNLADKIFSPYGTIIDSFVHKLSLSFCVLPLMIMNAAADEASFSFKDHALQKMHEHNVVGAAVGTIENGQLSDIKYLGIESVNTQEPVDSNSLFQVGSVSKPVAAWAAMTLVRDGKLDLDEPVEPYLTRWRIPDSSFDIQQVTLRRLLSHTAGFSLGGYGGFPEGQKLPSLEESLSGNNNGAGDLELFQEPGAGFRYSGGGYTLLQLLIEEISGMSFNDYTQLAVLQPLGMTKSSYEPPVQLLKQRVQPHGPSLYTIPQHDFRAQAAASLHTTANDLVRFVLANLNENTVLSSDMVGIMHSPVADAGFADIGLGFFSSANGRLVGHQGANFGWRAEIQFDHLTGNGLVIMTNSEGAAQFLADVKCDWDARQAQPLLTKACDEMKSQANLANVLVSIIACLIFIVISCLIWMMRTGRAHMIWPRTKARLVGLLIAVSLTLCIVAFIYTPLGVYLIGGFRSIFATIHYAPPLVAKLVPWLCCLLVLTWTVFFVSRTKIQSDA